MWVIFFNAVKFGAVGILGMFIDFLFTWIGKEKLKLNKFLANAIGFVVAVCSNYLLNRIWTFASRNPQVFQQFLQFLAVSTIGLALNMLFLYLLHEKLKLNFYLSKLFAIALVFTWNFTANYLFTFKNGH